MNESEFEQKIEATMMRIEEAIDASNMLFDKDSSGEIDYDTAGGILTLYFADQSQIIINRQTPLKQLWIAAKSGGYHYDYRDNGWINVQTGKPVWEELSQFCSEQSQRKIVLS